MSVTPWKLLWTLSAPQLSSAPCRGRDGSQGMKKGWLPSDHVQDVLVSPIHNKVPFTNLCSSSFSSWSRTLARPVLTTLQYLWALTHVMELLTTVNRWEMFLAEAANDFRCFSPIIWIWIQIYSLKTHSSMIILQSLSFLFTIVADEVQPLIAVYSKPFPTGRYAPTIICTWLTISPVPKGWFSLFEVVIIWQWPTPSSVQT